MSVKRKNDPPGFKLDPTTGKYVLAPLDLRALLGDDYEPNCNQPQQYISPWSNGKKFGAKNNNLENQHPHKYKKLEHGVRKELFKQPPSENEKRDIRASFGARRSSISRNLAGSSKPSFISKKTTQPKKGLPTITEVGSMLSLPSRENGKKAGLSPKLPEPSTPKDLGIKERDIENVTKTPGVIEFLKIEELLKTPKLTVESPVSTVCNLFENKMLIDGEKEESDINFESSMDIFAEIKRVARRDQELCEDTMKKIKEVQEQQLKHQENFKTILSLIDKLQNQQNIPAKKSENNKETSSIKRRSLRLRNKSPKVKSPQPPTKSDSITGSPVILKPGDLRKSALTKSLVKNCEKYQINSPRIKQ
ncbi:uncharacterized protein LOC126744271 isoform X2 [Anthonomus grandis grandis]|uniref:uncharacterized protein LOC126744271 isoform X2 n=1 Tax=Anthonomus grandis grandis TaxID=2921223 RepID=UPI0021667A73|nr:uncharacterized protein LOC126744271 isoform X2 [Anthonomus grandis grandis]